MKSAKNRGIWLGAFLAVLVLPILFYVLEGGRAQTSIPSRLLSLTGTQCAGLLVFITALGSRFKSRESEFGVPLHRWLGSALLISLLVHVLLALSVDPDNLWLLTMLWAPARGAAGGGALLCLLIALGLGELRKRSKIPAKQWRPIHVGFAWIGSILALAHILWIDQLVNNPLWLLLFGCILLTAVSMWLTRTKGVSDSTTGAVPKFIKWTFIVAAILAVVATVLSWRDPGLLTVGYSQHQLGPVGPADRDMLYKVKQAGLWEMPVGQEASTRATTTQFRSVAQKIAVEHHELDRLVTEVATKLGVQLPDSASPDQQTWMREISASSSGDYDRTAVFLLRQAHGKILPVLAQVRAGTRNAEIRAFANEAMTYVNRHIGYLDSTGLVNYTQLPEPPAPSPYQQPAEANFFESRDIRTIIVSSIVVAAVAVLATMLLINLFKSQPSTGAGTAKTQSVVRGTPPRHLKGKT